MNFFIFSGAEKGEWSEFHDSHYDWWAFPLNEPSSKGFSYTISAVDGEALINDKEFISTFRKGASLVLLSWGWDVHINDFVPDHLRGKGQSWADWPVRCCSLLYILLI